MSETKQAKEEQEVRQGLVLYTDGGARPNPGAAGWGIHGYMFKAQRPKRGSGNPEHLLTTHGYVLKADHKDESLETHEKDWDAVLSGKRKTPIEITPIHYVDGYGSFDSMVTNNVAELVAATRAFVHAAEHNVHYVRIFTDSEYVRKGLESWVAGWIRNNWFTSTGEPVKNREYWEELLQAREALQNRGCFVQISWVKGHDDHLGNELADQAATAGVMISRRLLMKQPVDVAPNAIQTTQAEGYWKYDTERHPMIANTKMYYNTHTDFLRPGEYYLGEHGNDPDQAGKRMADGAYALVRLTEADPVLELVRNYQSKLSENTAGLMMARLDEVYRSQTHKQLSFYGEAAMIRGTKKQENTKRLDLNTLSDQELTYEFRPPKIAIRVVEAIQVLGNRLESFLLKEPHIVVTDLTPILYERSVKEGKKGTEPKEIMTLKPEYNVGFAALPVQANYQKGDGIAQAPVILTLGIDMLNRNALKRLEGSLPKVSLISWLESPEVFRYATVVEAGGDVGIWAGVYSNVRMVV